MARPILMRINMLAPCCLPDLPATNPPRQYELALRRLAKNVDVSPGRGERISPSRSVSAPTAARASLAPGTQVLALGVPEEVERSKARGSNLSLTRDSRHPLRGKGGDPRSRGRAGCRVQGYFPTRGPRRKPECSKMSVWARLIELTSSTLARFSQNQSKGFFHALRPLEQDPLGQPPHLLSCGFILDVLYR
jgi:hypothetical protein